MFTTIIIIVIIIVKTFNFPTVLHPRLLHNLRKRKIPIWIIKWVESFLKNRKTTLTINARSTSEYLVNTGVSQGSFISFILYLFFNADLLKACENTERNASDTGFVNDVNILAYNTSTEENCKVLEHVHRTCEKWTKRHKATFASIKYELIHLVKNSKKFDMTATIFIAENNIKPKKNIRILKLQINTMF